MSPALPPWPYPIWIAHRGAGELAPENTLAAFRLGAGYGFRMFECDAKLSADGMVFLLHDTTLERTTNGRGPAGAHSWADLLRLDAGRWHSRQHAGEPLCSLQDVADFCLARGLALNIEIKPTPGAEAATGARVAKEAARLWATAAVPPLLTSFSAPALEAARKEAPALPRGLLVDGWQPATLQTAGSLDCVALVAHHRAWNADTFAQARQAGLRCLCFTVNDAPEAARLQALGLDGIITDRVDLFAPDSPP